MSARKIAVVLALLLAVVSGTLATVLWALFQTPDFYAQAIEQRRDPVVRRQAAKQFVQKTVQLVEEIKQSDQWAQTFTEEQTNSWLAEELHQKYPEWVPPGVSEPRVKLADGSIQVGFRFDHKKWQGVVSVQLTPWLVRPNELAVRIESVRAGLMPVPLDEVLEEIAQRIRTDGWRIEWTNHEGQDVAIVHLSRGRPDEPTLESVEVSNGEIRIRGARRLGDGSVRFSPPRVAEQSEVLPRIADPAGGE